MKHHALCSWIVALSWTFLCGGAVHAADPAQRHITAKVSVDSSSDYKKIAGTSEKIKSNTRRLAITLENMDKEPADDVSVKWAIYARKMDNKKLFAVKQGTEKIKLSAQGKTTVQSQSATMKGNDKYTVTTQRRENNGRIRTDSKKHPAEGEEYVGYSVEVYVGSTLIQEIYSNPSLKNPK
jgi:uncharacterized membrane protein YdfJ with MMPL/SSD domain